MNARPVIEPYVDASHEDGTYFGPVTVPPGTVLVLGDNRGSSIDSRDYGPVELDRLLRTVLVTWRIPRRSPRTEEMTVCLRSP